MNPIVVRALTVVGIVALATAVGYTARTAGAAPPAPPVRAECVLRPPTTAPSLPAPPTPRMPGRLTPV